ncbi:hypothetical protein IA01_11470 [Flavobacterium psychrophilum]|uniref:PKD domain-containing protein n=2 Tax=Flavobacterium psychrophilum TaxID=96345 RepID=A6H1Z1_FLAPJ|nr:T9SS C-terminal target domain-containing protein [Flavobacterium psychrophilum]AIG31036.1 hypothetical protein IA03_11440 [Flavobacterium psychrophilum]AIG33313.1 hypothetical protein IA01_11470 [Flavobacterium psychrophilum]AIG35462.1 hypothetical protein IA02_10835 [Flavobacterium psychrophilum]AIG37823.1 hypothetical protein IA04_11315 [Flavobacterium psychrophilum]AIG40094.1 hypothetical protein IA05_11435 [Flavobacterium psychrophilum]
MKKFILLVVFLFLSSQSFAQGEANIWYFGYKAGLDFNSGAPVALTNGQLNTQEGCAVISTAAGQLLFYTDGITIWDKNHAIMPNGTGLKGHPSSTQSALVVPKPGSTTIYYLFTISDKGTSDGFRYSEVDMSLNGGFGAVNGIKNVPIQTPVCEKLTAVKNANNDGFWVLVHGFGDDGFYAYSVTSLGINMTPVVSHVGIVVANDLDTKAIGYMKFSANGAKVIACHNRSFMTELFDFNTTTGVLTNPKIVSLREGPYGAEFSQSGNIAYVTTEPTGSLVPAKLFQYDLTASNIPSTEVLLYSTINSTYYSVSGALQMGPNGKIYSAGSSNLKLNVISNPEILGVGCNFVPNIVELGDSSTDHHFSKYGLPQFIQSVFDSNINVQNLCLGSATNFMLSNTLNVISINWNFGDGSPTQIGLNPNHLYATSGDYTITATVTSTSGMTSINKTIKIYATPVANSVSNQSICGTTSMSYDLSQFNNTILGSQSNTVFGVSYFSSLVDANANTNSLPVNQNLPLGVTTFYAKIYNIANPSCNAITSFTVTLSQQPVANAPTDYVICENAPYNNMEQFDLSTKNSEVLNGQIASNYTITYHASQANATNDVGALPILYTNTLSQEVLYVRIENNSNPACFATTPLTIKVIQQPILSVVSDFKLCDDSSNNGIENFNLALKTTEILNGQSPSTFEVKYYNSLLDAQNNTSEITTTINNTSNNQIIYFSISGIGNSNCKVTGSFELIVNKLPVANTITPVFICDDVTNDGIGIFNLQNNTNTVLGTQNASDFTVSYHISQNDANSDSNTLPLSYQNATNPQIIYVRVENNLNTTCFTTKSFQIGLFKLPVANQPQNLISCSNTSVFAFNLTSQTNSVLGTQLSTEYTVSYYSTQADANSGNNHLPSSYTNTSSPQTIYARIVNNLSNQCFGVTSFQLIVRQKPILNMKDIYSICEGSTITIDAPIGFSSYTWSNGDTTPSTVLTLDGNYSLTVTKNYGDIICDTTQNFVVYNSNIATINNIQISDWTANQNTIEIFVTGDGNYQYSIDGVTYQDSPQFIGLPSGVFTIYVKDKKGCGIATDEVFLLMYPKFFTPNGDGYNDYWNIDYVQYEPELSVSIFDRFGKLIKTFKGSEKGWNGTFNGQSLPSTDYWFVVKRKDGKEYKGHFSLKR